MNSVALADANCAGRLLLDQPKLFLLDEPTNHLDLETRNWLEGILAHYPFGYILCSHDRYFLDVTIDRTVESCNKRLTIYQGNYTKYLARKESSGARQLMATLPQSARAASSTLRPSSTASATRAAEGRERVQSRIKELERSSASRFPKPSPSFISSFLSHHRRAAWWLKRRAGEALREKHVFGGRASQSGAATAWRWWG